MNWFIPSLLALLLYGVWGFLPKLTSKYLDPTSAILYEVIGGIIVGLITLVFLRFRPEFNLRGALYGAGTGVCMLAGGLCYLYATKNGNLPVVVTITAIYPAITILLSYLVLGDAMTMKQIIGLGFACVAIILVAS